MPLSPTIIDIVLPCYNPTKDWVASIITAYDRIQAQLPLVGLQIILVNDGSTQPISSVDIAMLQQHIPLFKYINNTINKGKGAALRTGVAASKNDICIYTDVDFPYTIPSFIKIYKALTQDNIDIAVGIKDEQYYQHVPPFRRFISKTLRWLIRHLLQISITDTQCGLKGFNKEGKKVFLQTTINRYLFDLEFICSAERKKALTLQAIPITLKEGVVFSKVNWRILATESSSFLKILFKQVKTTK